MQKGNIGVTTENIFPIIKKFLYSDHDIFLRELVSNAVDATQKLKALARMGKYSGSVENATVRVKLDKEAKTITISDEGIGMTAEEIEKYINQIAFSGANDFLDQYKDSTEAIIGHFGLGFYSSFMVSSKVEIFTKSHKEGSQAVRWECDGSPEYVIEDTDKATVGTDIILHVDDDSTEFLEESRLNEILDRYCKFLAVPVAFGKKKDWKDGKEVELDEDNQINDTEPAWTKKPADLKEEDYQEFYKKLYPMSEDPLFNIHLNVDYPFNLTGILYFPKIKSNIEINKNKIQLYCNQVFVTDSVEGIVPEFLTLLHGVIDSPDIPLNVSRSYLQSDSNVKKISNHITKKVADRLNEIFKNNREEFEKKWDDLKLFITYGLISDEKFYERGEKFSLLKNTEGKYFTLEEYKEHTTEKQTDKNNQLIYLYTTDVEEQYAYIEKAKAKGYDVLVLDGQLDAHFINHVEPKLENTQFTRVDADIIDNLIKKDEQKEAKLSQDEKGKLRPIIESQLPGMQYYIMFEDLSEEDYPMVITQSEFMRRMKDMSALNGGMSGMYGAMPDSYNMVVNANHPLFKEIITEAEEKVGEEVKAVDTEIAPFETEKQALLKLKEGKKDEEVPQEEKEKLEDTEKKITELTEKKNSILKEYGKSNKVIGQLIDLAMLAKGQLKGAALEKFVKRSVDLIEK